MRTDREIRRAMETLDVLLVGDRLRPDVVTSPSQELSILVTRDCMAWFLGVGPGARNIAGNLARLASLGQTIAAAEGRN